MMSKNLSHNKRPSQPAALMYMLHAVRLLIECLYTLDRLASDARISSASLA